MKLVVTGAGGMVGQAVTQHCSSLGDSVVAFTHRDLDISKADSVSSALEQAKPEAIINCAAWTDVDGCEANPDKAFQANALGPQNLAISSRKLNAVFLTISTDYVFDGDKEGFFTQGDEPHPLSVYAASKLEGERLAQNSYAATIVVRTGFVFGEGGRNFLSTIPQRACKGEKLTAITDAYGSPTYAKDLAKRLRELVSVNVPGIYHVVNSGEGVSFEEFAREVVRLTGCDAPIEGVTMSALHRPAPRPRNSRLRCLQTEAVGLQPMRNWREALSDFIQQDLRSLKTTG